MLFRPNDAFRCHKQRGLKMHFFTGYKSSTHVSVLQEMYPWQSRLWVTLSPGVCKQLLLFKRIGITSCSSVDRSQVYVQCQEMAKEGLCILLWCCVKQLICVVTAQGREKALRVRTCYDLLSGNTNSKSTMSYWVHKGCQPSWTTSSNKSFFLSRRLGREMAWKCENTVCQFPHIRSGHCNSGIWCNGAKFKLRHYRVK